MGFMQNELQNPAVMELYSSEVLHSKIIIQTLNSSHKVKLYLTELAS